MKTNYLKILSFILLISLCSCGKKVASSSFDTSSSNKDSVQETINNSSFFDITSSNVTSSSSEDVSSINSSSISLDKMNYQDRISLYMNSCYNLNSKYISDLDFINYVKSLEEYKVDDEIVENAIYASSEGDGDGSFSSPYSFQDALDNVKKGQTIYLLEGTYSASDENGFSINVQGEKNNYITIRPYKNHKVLITNKHTSKKEVYCMQIDDNAKYFILEGLEIGNVSAQTSYGIVSWGGQDHIIIRNNNIHDLKTTKEKGDANGILFNGEKSTPTKNVFIMNNEIHNNVTGWSESLSILSNNENIYILENNVYDNTNIGIDFNGNLGDNSANLNKDSDQPRYSIAMNNKIKSSVCKYADAAGLYVDGAREILLEFNEVSYSQYGIEIGAEENKPFSVNNIVVRNNILKDNLTVGLRIGGYEDKRGLVENSLIVNNTLINNNENIVVAKAKNISFINNIIYCKQNVYGFAYDDACKQIEDIYIKNNLFYIDSINKNDVSFYINFKEILGIDNLNSLINVENNFYQEIHWLDSYFEMSEAIVDKGIETKYGEYDFNLKKRVKGKMVDLGAIEFE